jgi:hypothetical protein
MIKNKDLLLVRLIREHKEFFSPRQGGGEKNQQPGTNTEAKSRRDFCFRVNYMAPLSQ